MVTYCYYTAPRPHLISAIFAYYHVNIEAGFFCIVIHAAG